MRFRFINASQWPQKLRAFSTLVINPRKHDPFCEPDEPITIDDVQTVARWLAIPRYEARTIIKFGLARHGRHAAQDRQTAQTLHSEFHDLPGWLCAGCRKLTPVAYLVNGVDGVLCSDCQTEEIRVG